MASIVSSNKLGLMINLTYAKWSNLFSATDRDTCDDWRNMATEGIEATEALIKGSERRGLNLGDNLVSGSGTLLFLGADDSDALLTRRFCSLSLELMFRFSSKSGDPVTFSETFGEVLAVCSGFLAFLLWFLGFDWVPVLIRNTTDIRKHARNRVAETNEGMKNPNWLYNTLPNGGPIRQPQLKTKPMT